ncbi:hypothetical protein [Paractinoplanes atraurantiacus]|uniref:Uncharacterized protein n=1 Tax=Paractinoplanes atraurantiacus TaxID=1036182 RepID=A0A285JI35_9ACTN|nr:hypothetical protein [Actinoplanes atraurantiacus]SNY59970.1 hypothetical protein SAMN05421748_12121 [Actinoplanes atraurantiacus]
MLKPTRRIAAALTSAALGLALLTGCSSDNVDCGLDQCTVTIQRETSASASFLGVEAKFISADANTVTLEVAGEQISLTKGQQAVEVAGLQVQLDSVTAETIGLQVSKA